MLHTPAPIRSLRKIPAQGSLIHYLRRRILPTNERLFARIEVGPAPGISPKVGPRAGDYYVRGRAEVATQSVLAERQRP